MKRKYELNPYTPCQFADIRDHLEAMALRGWRLERMEEYFLVYRRGEPKPVRYALVFHPEMGYLEPAPTPEGEVYRDYCRQAGWEPVAFWSNFPQIEVYCNEAPHPIPLQTDRTIQWRVMGDWLERRYVPRLQTAAAACSLIFLLSAIFCALFLIATEDWAFRILTLCLIALLIYLTAVPLIQLANANRWLSQVRRAEEELGEGTDGRLPPLLRWMRKAGGVLSAFALLYCVWYMATQGGGIPSLVRSVGQTAVLLLVWWGMGRAEDWLRRYGRSQAANWVGYGVVVVLAFFILQLRSTLF